MELTSEQKHDISVQLNASDIYETVPFLNKVLAAIGYVDRLDDDSEREELRWTKRKEPLIKDEKIRKAVRTWAEASGITKVLSYGDIFWLGFRSINTPSVWKFECSYTDTSEFKVDKEYTIDELCGEEEE